MISANMLVQIATLLGPVSAVRALELGFLAALVSRVSQQSGAMLVTLAACLATIWEKCRTVALVGRPQRGQVLDQHWHCREEAVPRIQVLGQNRARYRSAWKREEEENGGR